jgi:hypothetical protein
MRESADSSTRHQRYHVLSAATLSNGGNRNFVHMKVMVDAGVSCIRGSRKPFAVTGSSAACSKEAPFQDAYPVDSTDKEWIVDGWRPATARPLPRSPPSTTGSRRHQHTASRRDVI